MYRTAPLRPCFDEYVHRDYPVWGGDVVWLASLVLRFPVVGTEDAVFYKQEYDSRFRPKGEAEQWRTWSSLFRWQTWVAWHCTPSLGTALAAVWSAWRYCFKGYLSRGNPIGTAVRCAKVGVLGTWFTVREMLDRTKAGTLGNVPPR